MSSFWEIKVFLHRLSKFEMTLVADNGEDEIEKEGCKTFLCILRMYFDIFEWKHHEIVLHILALRNIFHPLI